MGVGATDCDEHLLALLLMLKSYQRMGCFPRLEDVPEMVVDFVRRAVELPEGKLPLYQAVKTAKNHRGLVRQRVGVVYDQAEARRIAEASIRSEAAAKNRPADLINIALFAGEADAADASELKAYTPVKRVAMVACLVHKARMRVRDELALMFCKRVGSKTKRAKEELEALRLAEREMTETLIGNYRTVLKHLDDGGPAQEALAKAAAMTAETVTALQGLDEQALADEVARRLEGKVSPAVLAFLKAMTVQAGGLVTEIDPEDLAHISPYLTEHIKRFGEYSTHELGIQPEAYDPHLDVDFSPLRGDHPESADGYGQAA